jgi:hypothetical protein
MPCHRNMFIQRHLLATLLLVHMYALSQEHVYTEASPCNGNGGGGNKHTDIAQDELISLPLFYFFQNKEYRMKTFGLSYT